MTDAKWNVQGRVSLNIKARNDCGVGHVCLRPESHIPNIKEQHHPIGPKRGQELPE